MCQCFRLNVAIVKQRINAGPDATHLYSFIFSLIEEWEFKKGISLSAYSLFQDLRVCKIGRA